MLIKYDLLVLEDAVKKASKPDALQRDIARHAHDHDVLQWYPSNGPYVSYLAPEVDEEIHRLYINLPRRESQNKFKKNNNINGNKL